MNDLSARIKEKAHELGFDLCGIAKSRPLDEQYAHLNDWIAAGMNDKMEYLARDIHKRLDPADLFPGAQSLVLTGLSYYSEKLQKDPEAPVLSRYSYGIDYHFVIIEKLKRLFTWIKSVEPEAGGRCLVDTAPVLEKAWAIEAGLGWRGRHSVIINKNLGSFFFIGVLILNLDLEYDTPETEEYCGECRKCLEACPTGAINENRTIDTRKCIANLTIESRGPIPEELLPKLGRRIYGCDRCQEVCPWNNKIKVNNIPEFKLNEKVAGMTLSDWVNLSREQFVELFKKTPVGRADYDQFIRNIKAVTNSE